MGNFKKKPSTRRCIFRAVVLSADGAYYFVADMWHVSIRSRSRWGPPFSCCSWTILDTRLEFIEFFSCAPFSPSSNDFDQSKSLFLVSTGCLTVEESESFVTGLLQQRLQEQDTWLSRTPQTIFETICRR